MYYIYFKYTFLLHFHLFFYIILFMKTIIVSKENNGKKLNTVLLKEFPTLSINSVYKALRKKDIRVNDIRVSENVVVHSGDIVKVFITDDILCNGSLIKNANFKQNRNE